LWFLNPAKKISAEGNKGPFGTDYADDTVKVPKLSSKIGNSISEDRLPPEAERQGKGAAGMPAPSIFTVSSVSSVPKKKVLFFDWVITDQKPLSAPGRFFP
jgi:hypothetical protein